MPDFFPFYCYSGLRPAISGFATRCIQARDVAYSTALIFVVLVNLGFFLTILLINTRLSAALNYANHPEYVLCFTLILTLDAIASIPFARLRAEDKAFRFAGIKVTEILITVLLSLFFIIYCPKVYAENPQSWIAINLQSSDWHRLYFYRQPDCQSIQVFVACTPVKGLGLGF